MTSSIRLCCFIILLALAPLIHAESNNTLPALTLEDITSATQPTSNAQMDIPLTQEVVDEINQIRSNEFDRKDLLAAIKRMKEDQPKIQHYLDEYHIPSAFLALPLVLSNYTALGTVAAPEAAGVWGITIQQANDYGLIIDSKRDDRFNIQRSTEMMYAYLTDLYAQFKDWLLVASAVNLGEKETKNLIANTNPHDAWTLARSPSAPSEFMTYLVRFSAYALILRCPELLTDNIKPKVVGD